MSDRLTRGPILAWAVGIFAALATAGVACGLLWRARLDAPHGIVVGGQWYPDPWDTGEQAAFAATGWYVVIALVAGVVLGLLAAWLSRAPEVVTLAAVLLGSLAAGWLMLVVGLHGSPADPQAAAAHAADGTRLSGAVSRPGAAAFVTWPLAAIVPLAALFLLVPGRHPGPARSDG
jgi:ribose/xylose/arabinose/galactoside ABC-type transport system permease subunit